VLGLVLLLLEVMPVLLGCGAGWNIGWFVDVGTLLGPEGTPCLGLFLLASGPGCLMPCLVGVVVAEWGWGVVVC
jgi:hypothetical protein